MIPLKQLRTEMREASEKATQNWEYERQDWENGDTSYEFNGAGRLLAVRQSDYDQPMRAKFDADHIALANPANLKRLLDALDAAEEALVKIKSHGCCIMHNDHGCPGCTASDALKDTANDQ